MNTPVTFEQFKANFCSSVVSQAADGEVFPHPAWFVAPDHGVSIHALALDGMATLRHMRATVRQEAVWLLAYGLDCFTKPDQGTTRASVFAFTVADLTTGRVEHGIVEYEAGPARGVVDAPRFDNDWWSAGMGHNLEFILGR